MASKPMIKPSHRGLLHKQLGIAPNKLIPRSRIESALAAHPDPAEKKRLIFAQNFGKRG